MTSIGMHFANELEGELSLCRQILERIPAHLLDWQPHPKSPSTGELSVHIADMIDWIKLAATTAELDYAVKPHEHYTPASTSALLAYFDQRAGGTAEANPGPADHPRCRPGRRRAGRDEPAGRAVPEGLIASVLPAIAVRAVSSFLMLSRRTEIVSRTPHAPR